MNTPNTLNILNSKKASIVELQDVTFGYTDQVVLKNVNLTIEEGECLCIVGPNGGGKTTLLKLILGLLQPQTGQVRVFGKFPKESLSKVSYMSQLVQVDPLFPIRVIDVVLMGRVRNVRWGGFYSKSDKKAAEAILERLGILNLKHESLSELSGGQRQRVMIARALVGDPELLLLDEPTNNIDIQVEAQLLKLLHELKEHMTILMVTHDAGFVSSLVKRVICVHKSVSVHPTSEIQDTLLKGIYGTDLRVVRHDENLIHPNTDKKDCCYHE